MGKRDKLRQAQASYAEAVRTALDPARQTYAERWKVSASSFAEDGHYEWMASFLPSNSLVLEVGVGTGHSTEAISRVARCVVGVDENPTCVQEALSHLKNVDVRCKAASRQSLNPSRDAHYDLNHKKIESGLVDDGVLLLEGDLAPNPSDPARCIDNNLESWLSSQGGFDAIACWLIGTHDHRHANLAVAKRGVGSSGEYRLFVQNFVYELADRILRPGGILHIVDRGPYDHNLAPAVKEDALKAHGEQASVTSLQVDPQMKQRPYNEATGGIPMLRTPPASGIAAAPPPSQDQLFFTSIVATKKN